MQLSVLTAAKRRVAIQENLSVGKGRRDPLRGDSDPARRQLRESSMTARADLDCPPRASASVRRRPRAARASTSSTRLAVIPFDDLTAGGQASVIADALTVLVVANLACVDAVDVLSCASTMRYKGAHAALADIARNEGAGGIVEGAVLRRGREVQVLVQLLDAHTGEALLVRTYTGQAATIERIQAEIAWEIVDELVAAVCAA